MRIHPYLNFDGDCKTAFEFYARTFGGKIEAMQTHGDSPMKAHTPREHHDRILHARLTIGDAVIMGSDSPPDRHETPQGGLGDNRRREARRRGAHLQGAVREGARANADAADVLGTVRHDDRSVRDAVDGELRRGDVIGGERRELRSRG